MTDYWNDPPETPELPECCGEEMDAREDGSCLCIYCGRTVDAQPDIEPIVADVLVDLDDVCLTCGRPSPRTTYCSAACSRKCLHGNEWDDCSECDHLGDLAYDAAREAAGR